MTDQSEPRKSLLSRLHTETALYGLVFVAALALRLIDLDARPLGLAEAGRALDAWRLAQGQPVSSVGSPLLLNGTAALFFIFTANDFTARLLPALFGALVVLLPYFWRQRLGGLGALLAACFLAFSPLGLFVSRSVGPEVIAAGCALAALTGVMAFADSGDKRYVFLAAASLALLLASGPGAYFALLVFAVSAVAILLLRRDGGAFAAGLRERLQGEAGVLRAGGLVFLGAALGVGTLLFFNLKGMQGFGDVLAAWWQGFGGAANLPWFSPLLYPLLYEPLILVFGIAGGILAVQRREVWASLLFGWGLGSAALLMAWPARTSGDFLLVSVPFALLAGKGVAHLFDHARADWRGMRDGVFVLVFGILAVYVYLQVSGFADRGDRAFVILAWVGVALAAALTVGQAILYGHANALRNLGLAGVGLTLLVTLSAAMGSAYNAGGKNAEILDPLPVSPRIKTLAADAGAWSLRKLGDEREQPVTIAMPESSTLAWYLRDFRYLEIRGSAGGAITSAMVVTPEGAQTSLEGSYSGQPYEFLQDRRWKRLPARDWWKWALWRAPWASAYNRVVLWVKAGAAEVQ